MKIRDLLYIFYSLKCKGNLFSFLLCGIYPLPIPNFSQLLPVFFLGTALGTPLLLVYSGSSDLLPCLLSHFLFSQTCLCSDFYSRPSSFLLSSFSYSFKSLIYWVCQANCWLSQKYASTLIFPFSSVWILSISWTHCGLFHVEHLPWFAVPS